MSVIFLLIPVSIIIAACFLGAFVWAVRSGQYEDTCTPSMRVLLEDAAKIPASRAPRGANRGPAVGGESLDIQKLSRSATHSDVFGEGTEHDALGAGALQFSPVPFLTNER